VTLVTAQSGVSINAAYAALLIAWANDLIARLEPLRGRVAARGPF